VAANEQQSLLALQFKKAIRNPRLKLLKDLRSKNFRRSNFTVESKIHNL